MPYVERAGVKVFFETQGTAPPAVLFTHGFAASSRMFAIQSETLSDQFQVVRWDLMGHGQSDYPSDPDRYSVPASLEHMVGILDTLGIDQAVLAGHSVGGYLSLEFYLAHPERVRALVLIDTGPGYRKDDARAEWNAMAESFAARFEELGLDALGKSSELDRVAHRDATGLVHVARRILVQHDARVMDLIPNVAVPTLVVVGERDKPYRQAADYLSTKIPDATLVVVPEAGHAPNLSNPAVFDKALSGFVGGLGHQ